MKKSTSSEPKYGAVFEKVGSRSDDRRFRGLLEGRFGDDAPLEEIIMLGWMEVGVYS
jgi:hypothetical protein